jgi:hypothetical protein
MSDDLVKMLDEKVRESLAFAPAYVPDHLMSIAARRIELLERELAEAKKDLECINLKLANITVGPYMASPCAFGDGWEAARSIMDERIKKVMEHE